MELLFSVAEKLYDSVKTKFKQDIEQREITIPATENAFWKVNHNGNRLFTELIGDFEPLFLRDKVNYRQDRQYTVLGKNVLNFNHDDRLAAFLEYLNCEAEQLQDQLDVFLKKYVTPEERQFQQDHLNKPLERRRDRVRPREDIQDLTQENAKLLSRRYAPRLLGEKFWFFFYGYDKFKGIPGKQKDKWPLVKLLFRFTEMSDIDIRVELDNNGDTEHHDYIGKTDFLTSWDGVLVINCRTYPDFTRQLNIKINIGKGEGDIFLGQYMNYESEGRIISGSVLLQRINNNEANPKPTVHHIPQLLPGVKMYQEDIEGVNKCILQYLHDKKLNFRRTSLRAGHSIESLENWLKHHHEEE